MSTMAHATRRALLATASLAAVTALSTLAGPAVAAPSAAPATSCSTRAYAYAGLSSNEPAQGIQAVVTTLAAPHVPYGHVAGWIGVGGTDADPNGEAEWLQTGIVTLAGNDTELYAEITRPGSSPRYVTLAGGLAPGSTYRLAVVRLPGRFDAWQVLVNGRPATGRVALPGSSSFEPMAMSESWNGGSPACNGYAYRFAGLRIATGGSWRAMTDTSTLADRGYAVVDRTRAGFTALSA
jgi:hypothetical protein